MKRVLTLAALALMLSLSAMALPIPNEPWYDATTHPSSPTAEKNLYEIVNLLYGTSYASNAAMEFAALSTEVFAGWHSVEAEAKYAGNDPQEMGWYQPTGAGAVTTRTELLKVSGKGVEGFGDTLSGTLSNSANPVGPFGFYLESPSGSNKYFYSENWRNSGSEDHAILYDLGLLVDSSYNNMYLMGWEDKTIPNGSDRDFQDLVVELTVVPEPASMLLLGVGIAGMMVRRFRK